MMTMTKMTVKTEGDKHVVVTRRFAASPEAVYRAHTEPSILQKWLLGPDGWTMPVCALFTWSECTSPIPRQTIMLKRRLSRTATAH